MRKCLPSEAQKSTLGDSRRRLIFILEIERKKLNIDEERKTTVLPRHDHWKPGHQRERSSMDRFHAGEFSDATGHGQRANRFRSPEN